MINNTSQAGLMHELQQLVQAHRSAFKQERPFWRAVGLVLGEVFNFGRHTVTQDLLTLGLNEGDWSGWYRLFSRERFDEEQLNNCLLEETLKEVKEDEPYCAALDSTVVGSGLVPARRSLPIAESTTSANATRSAGSSGKRSPATGPCSSAARATSLVTALLASPISGSTIASAAWTNARMVLAPRPESPGDASAIST